MPERGLDCPLAAMTERVKNVAIERFNLTIRDNNIVLCGVNIINHVIVQ